MMPPSADAMSLLDTLPAALVLLDGGGFIITANTAARQLLGTLADAGTDFRQALGLESAPAWPTDPVPLPGTSRHLGLRRADAAGGGVWLQLEDQTALADARRELQRQGELLDVAQDFGRLGVWQRDVRTLQGRWDRHVYKFWGLGPDATAPEFDIATRQIVDEDRVPLQEAFRVSTQRAGMYAHRFRVRRPDGGITHLHSQWAVKNGPDGQPERVIGIMMDDTEAVSLARSRHEMESQLALAEALAGLIVWRHDLRTDRMQFNRQGYALIERPPSDDGVPAAEVRALIHPQDLPQVLKAAEEGMHRDITTDIEARHAQADGSWRRILTRRVVQRDEQGEPVAVLGVALDITTRDADEQRARDMSARFDLATRTAGIGYWAREGENQRAYWSDQMRALHGLSADAPVPTLNEWIENFIHPDDRADIRQSFQQWLSGNAPRVQAELRIVRADGGIRHLLTHSLQERGGELPVLFGIAIDVTDRRMADLALRRADERAGLAARGAGIGTWEAELRDGSTFWDEQMWLLRGREPRGKAPEMEELISFVHPDDLHRTLLTVRGMSETDDIIEHEFRVVWPDGRIRWLASRSTSIRDAQGRLLRRIGVNWDVTAARQAEADRSVREAAEQANRAKSEFLARMSHELRTPLNAVLGFTQLLLLDDSPDQRHPRLNHIQAAGRHLLSLIDDVLDLASLDTGEMRIDLESVDLAALLQETLPLVESLSTGRGITVSAAMGGLRARADRVRLRQVLLNLLSNACKYNREGGKVLVSARGDGAEVVIAVQDTGRGMSELQLRQLYEPFNRLGIQREGIEGTGIGLAIVKALVERMGGSIAVRSEPAVGTLFEVRLPLAVELESSGPQPLRLMPATQRRLDPSRGVLYIEDNAVNTLIVTELLQRRSDMRVLLASDGASGLATALREQPALVLLDMQLPDMDGLDVLARLRADPATAGIECIALSANALPEDVALTLASGAAAYWTKPLDAAAFTSGIDALFGPPPAP
jgi:PAS domain S-box-containing protein